MRIEQPTTNRAKNVLSRPTRPLAFAYYLSVRVLYFLCGQKWFRNIGTRKRRHAALLDLFLQETNYPQAVWPEIRRKALVTDLVQQLWGERFMDVAPLIVEGQEYAEMARSTGKGLIFVRFHQKLGRSRPSSPLSFWLEQGEFRPTITIHRGRKRQVAQPQTSEKLVNAQELFEANKILRKGGVIQIVPDGYYGSTAIHVEFYARNRGFRTGFAELAVMTQACVIPICLHFRMDGTLVIKLFPSLELSNAVSHEQAVAKLVTEYVTALGEFWKTYAHMIVYHHMKKHLNIAK